MSGEVDSWCVYILRCGDGSLYTGSTNRLETRVALHAAGKGAKYTRSRLPVELVWSGAEPGRGAALSREAAIKKWNRSRKLRFIKEC